VKDGRFKANNGNKIMIGGSLIVNESCFALIQRSFTLTSGSFIVLHGRKNNRRKKKQYTEKHCKKIKRLPVTAVSRNCGVWNLSELVIFGTKICLYL